MRDNVHPGEKWEFNGEVAACFANMLERSIPDYRSMRALTYKLGERFIQPETLIVDVGCSTGLAVEPFVVKYGQSNNFLLVDNAPGIFGSICHLSKRAAWSSPSCPCSSCRRPTGPGCSSRFTTA